MKKVNGKKKGNRVELQIAKIFTNRFKKTFKRVPMSGAFGTLNYKTNIRKDAIEILSGDIIVPKNFIYSIEVKSRKRFNFFNFFNNNSDLFKWLDQCEKDAIKSKRKPMLIIKINFFDFFVFLKTKRRISDFIFFKWQVITLDNLLKQKDNLFFTKR